MGMSNDVPGETPLQIGCRKPRRKPHKPGGLRRLPRVDHRTAIGKIIRQVEAELVAHCGGEHAISAPARLIIRRCVALTTELAVIDAKLAAGEEIGERRTREWLALSASLVRSLRALGLEKPKTVNDPRSALAGFIASKGGAT
jgi:hypothetical protein